jgi:hypothetical protein
MKKQRVTRKEFFQQYADELREVDLQITTELVRAEKARR